MISTIIDDIEKGKLNDLINQTIKVNKTDLIARGGNILYQITSTYNQNNYIYDNISVIQLEKCEKILKEQYKLDPNDILIIFKYDIEVNGLLIPLVGYEIFEPNEYKKLDLNSCKNENAKIEILNAVEINETLYDKINNNF